MLAMQQWRISHFLQHEALHNTQPLSLKSQCVTYSQRSTGGSHLIGKSLYLKHHTMNRGVANDKYYNVFQTDH